MKLAFILIFFLTLTACGGADGSGDSTPEDNIPTDTDNSSGGDDSDNPSDGDTAQAVSWNKVCWNQFNWQ